VSAFETAFFLQKRLRNALRLAARNVLLARLNTPIESYNAINNAFQQTRTHELTGFEVRKITP
jgi:hypothetical protein